MSKYRILLLLACLLVAFSGYCTELGKLVSTEAEILRCFPLTPDPSPRGRWAKENRRKFLLQYLQDAYGESPSTTQPTTPPGEDQQISWGWLKSFGGWLKSWDSTAIAAIATVGIFIFNGLLWWETKLTRLNQKMLERQGRDIEFLKQWQALLDEFLVLKTIFPWVIGEKGITRWYQQIHDFANKRHVFPDEIQKTIVELTQIANPVWLLDRGLQGAKEMGREPTDKDQREKRLNELHSEVSKKLQEVENAIKKHIQDLIYGKEQTSEGTN